MTRLYRLHTLQSRDLPTVVAQFFPGFTILPGTGYVDGFKEATATIEIYGTEMDREEVFRLARALAELSEVFSGPTSTNVTVAELGGPGGGIGITVVEPREEGAADIIPFPSRVAA